MAMGKRGRPRKIDREAVLDAALAVGLTDLSIKKVAAHLDVSMGTIYHHVDGIDHLYRLLADRLIGNLGETIADAPSLATRELLTEIGERLRKKFLDVPGHAEIAQRQAHLSGNILEVHERALVRLKAEGVRPELGFLMVRTLAEYVESAVAREERWRDRVDFDLAETLVECEERGFDCVREAIEMLAPRYLEDQFNAGLRVVVAGLLIELGRQR